MPFLLTVLFMAVVPVPMSLRAEEALIDPLAPPPATTQPAPDVLNAAKALAPPMSLQDQIGPSIDLVSEQVPPQKRAEFQVLMKQGLSEAVLREIISESLAAVFTTQELNAMRQFYATPMGRAVHAKMPLYAAEFQPRLEIKILDLIENARQRGLLPDAPPATPAPAPVQPGA